MKETNRILYLSYDGLTDSLGQSQILPYIQGLSKKGYKFWIISFEKADRLARLGNNIQKICDQIGIEWIPLIYTKKPPVLSTLKDLRILEAKARELNAKHKFQLIHCRSYLTSLVAVKLKRSYSIPFIFDMRGFWADERVDGDIWNLKNPVYKSIYKYFKVRERAFLEESDAVVSLTHVGKEELEKWFDSDPLFGGSENYYNYDRVVAVRNKTTVIPCATALDLFDHKKVCDHKKKWLGAVHGIDTSLEYLGYVGSLGTWYMGKEMIDLYAEIFKSHPHLRFLILSHDNIEDIRSHAIALGIPASYIVHVSADRRDVPVLMSLMSASVFFIKPAYSKKASSPTKQGELMAMGVPIICNAGVGDTAEIIEKYKAGYVVQEFSKNEYQKVAENWKKIISKDPSEERKGASEIFALEKGVDKYADIYRSILNLEVSV